MWPLCIRCCCCCFCCCCGLFLSLSTLERNYTLAGILIKDQASFKHLFVYLCRERISKSSKRKREKETEDKSLFFFPIAFVHFVCSPLGSGSGCVSSVHCHQSWSHKLQSVSVNQFCAKLTNHYYRYSLLSASIMIPLLLVLILCATTLVHAQMLTIVSELTA